MSRVRNSMKNAQISMIFMVLSLAVSFVSRRVFIDYLGTNLVGLTSTLQSILGFLNLAELGIVSAIASTLYKPLYEKDQEKIDDIISIFAYLYRWIGVSILGLGIIMATFLPLFFKDSGVSLIDVYAGYGTYLMTSMVGYFISYRQTLLDADQKQYVIVTWTNVAIIIKVILQIVCLKYWGGGYLYWLLIELIFGISYGFWINNKVTKYYPELETSYLRGKRTKNQYKSLFTTIKNVIPHKIGSFVLNQTSSILIYVFTSLSLVTIYTNYTMILNKSVVIITTAFTGIGASIGNLVAEGKKTYIIRVFWELQFVFFCIASVLVICSFYLVDPFINLWIGEGFLLDEFTFRLILINMFMGIIRIPVGLFLNGYVLFKDIWAPLCEATLNLLVGIIAGYYWGVAGVLLGTTCSLFLFVIVWKPIFLYREAFKESSFAYWKNSFGFIVNLIFTWGITNWIVSKYLVLSNLNFLQWLQNALIIFLSSASLYVFFAFLFCKGGKDVLGRVGNLLRVSK